MGSKLENPLIRGYREILGVGDQADAEELKKAYRKLARLYHPDVNPDPRAAWQFQRISRAYETLRDPKKRDGLNAKFLHERLYEKKIGGLKLNFGSFFGFRFYSPDTSPLPAERQLPGRQPVSSGEGSLRRRPESSRSITDSVACDHFELLFAGRFSPKDGQAIKKSMKGNYLKRLPWVVLNNQGILQFLEEDYASAKKTYAELNQRIPNNILFLYRLGVCHVVLAFQKTRKNIFGRLKPERRHLQSGIRYLKAAIAVGENREVGRQRCLTIHKVLADIYESAGMTKQRRQRWQKILELEPTCREAEKQLALLDALPAGKKRQ